MRCIKIPSEDFIFIGEKIESMANKYIFTPMHTTLSSMRILSYINCHKEITAKTIIELTGKTKSNITQRLNILEKNGLITRTKNPNAQDKRETYIKITPLGEKMVSEALRKIQKFHLSKNKFFTKKELEGHIKFMNKLSNFLTKEEEQLKKIFNQ
jgi:DNA-binding MarR family transcriptional regulator